jgi:hypothetical protein
MAFEVDDHQAAPSTGWPRTATGWPAASASTSTRGAWAYMRGPEGTIVSLAERIG